MQENKENGEKKRNINETKLNEFKKNDKNKLNN